MKKLTRTEEIIKNLFLTLFFNDLFEITNFKFETDLEFFTFNFISFYVFQRRLHAKRQSFRKIF